MPGTRRLRFRLLAVAWACLAPASTIAIAGEAPPTAAIPRPGAEADALARSLMPPRKPSATSSTEPGVGWWLGPVGIAAALAVFGGVSLASKRFLPTGDSGSIRVIGRSALSPKHSACLLRVGDRVLIVGFGPQGPPSTLGEITDPAELARLAPRRPSTSPVPKAASSLSSTGFDRRIGDDE